MCKAAKEPAGQQAAQKFIEAVQQLRKCNKGTLERQAEKMLARQDETERYGEGVWKTTNRKKTGFNLPLPHFVLQEVLLGRPFLCGNQRGFSSFERKYSEKETLQTRRA